MRSLLGLSSRQSDGNGEIGDTFANAKSICEVSFHHSILILVQLKLGGGCNFSLLL